MKRTLTILTFCFFSFETFSDTEHIYESIVRDIAKLYGKPYPWNIRMKILGTTEQMTASIAVKDLNLPITAGEFHLKYSELCRKRLDSVPLIRGTFNMEDYDCRHVCAVYFRLAECVCFGFFGCYCLHMTHIFR